MSICACKGIRTCLICEQRKGATRAKYYDSSPNSLTLCYRCGKPFLADTNHQIPDDPFPMTSCSPSCTIESTLLTDCIKDNLSGRIDSQYLSNFGGILVSKEFVSEEEETSIVDAIDCIGWAESQSGRKKQDYGPKVNFKRQKVKLGSFDGLPSFSELLIDRIHTTILQLYDFKPVELCNLDYSPKRGSAIDPHCDDSWLWGERLVTLNLLSHTVLTFTTPPTHAHKQTAVGTLPTHSTSMSCDFVQKCSSETIGQQESHTTSPQSPLPSQGPSTPLPSHITPIEVNVPLPRRSLVIVSGLARHVWYHSIKRENIVSRRIAVTLRELTPEFQEGGRGYDDVGRSLLETAASYNGHPTNFRL